MNDRDERGSPGSTLAIISGVALLLLALPCLAVAVLFGVRLLHVGQYVGDEATVYVEPDETLPSGPTPTIEVKPEPPPSETPGEGIGKGK